MGRMLPLHYNFTMIPLIKINKASVFIPGQSERQTVLHEIDLVVQPGVHISLEGANGSGKSTLLRLIHGDLTPFTGSIFWRGENGAQESSRIVARLATALVSPMQQERLQQLGWTQQAGEWLVQDDSLDPIPQDIADPETVAHSWLEKLGAENIWDMPISVLSLGQLRLCLLARAFLRKPGLLLLDEYADGLDAFHIGRVKDCFEELRKESTLLVVSHRAEHIPSWCGHKLEMAEGRLRPAKSGRQTPVRQPDPLFSQVGESLPDPLFRLHNVTVYLKDKLVLKNICWTCRQGEHWRICGANGAGKSTFLRLLAGDEFVAVGGVAQVWNSNLKQPARCLAEKRQLVSLVSDRIQACYSYDVTGLDLVCSGFDNSIGIYREFTAAEKKDALEAINFFFADEEPEKIAVCSIRCLSSGQLRRLFIARALVSRPQALLLDEPFSLLDSPSRARIAEFLQKLGTEGWQNRRPAIIFVSHNVTDAPACVQREAEIVAGKLLVRK